MVSSLLGDHYICRPAGGGQLCSPLDNHQHSLFALGFWGCEKDPAQGKARPLLRISHRPWCRAMANSWNLQNLKQSAQFPCCLTAYRRMLGCRTAIQDAINSVLHFACTSPVRRFNSESVLLQTPSFPPGDCIAAAPDESWIGECVIADHSSYPAAQAPSASAPRKSRKQQRASVRISDPLWQYAALAVYPDRLKTRTASS